MTVPLVLSLVVLLVLMGFAGSQHVSSVRASLDQVHGERVLELALDSAVEEVCARLEALPRCRDIAPPAGAQRDLAPQLALPDAVTPDLAVRDAAEAGVKIGAVSVRPGAWTVDYQPDGPGTVLIRERCVVEFRATLALSGSHRARRTFTVARYAEVSPDPGAAQGRLRFQHNDMVFRAE